MVLAEHLHAFLQYGIEFVAHTAGACPHTGFQRTCGVEVDAGHALGDEFADKFAARHAGIRKREEESVGNILGDIARIGDGEAVVAENLLHLACTLGIGLGVVHKVDDSIA